MPSFSKEAYGTPVGKRVYLRSTRGTRFESYTLAAATWPAVTIDGFANQKIAQPGTVLAKITVGSEAGKVGPFQAAGTNEQQTLTPSGTISGGTWTLTFKGATTTALAHNANAATIQAALQALSTVGSGNATVSGGPISSGVATVTFVGLLGGVDQPLLTLTSSLTGSTPACVVAQSVAGVAGATDGRQTLANIVGLLDTFLPWQLTERDVEVAALYVGTAVQANCVELDASGAEVVLTNTTADAMRSVKGCDITFH